MSIKAYKGFDKNMQCRGFQYEEGKTYDTKERIKICQSGFHACENPLDVFRYYNPKDSIYCEVDALGNIDKEEISDTKIATDKIKIGAKIDLINICGLAIEIMFEKIKSKTNKNKTASNYNAIEAVDSNAIEASNSNAIEAVDYNAIKASNSNAIKASNFNAIKIQDNNTVTAQNFSIIYGNKENEITVGRHSLACQKTGKMRGDIGSVLIFQKCDDKGKVIDMLVKKVDGKRIKANTWYTLLNGKFTEVQK